MRRRKVLMISTTLPYPLVDGSKVILYNLMKRLSRSHDITLLSLIGSDEERAFLPLLGAYGRIETVLHTVRNSNATRLRYLISPDPYGVSLTASAGMRAKARDLSAATAFDVIHCHYISSAQYAAVAPEVPKVIYATDCDSLYYLRRAQERKDILGRAYLLWQRHRSARYERRIYASFDAGLVVSDADKRALAETVPGLPVFVASNGVDTDYFKRTAPLAPSHRLIFTGSMDYDPNVAAVLSFVTHIFPLVRRQFPDAVFYVVGKSPPEGIVRLGRQDRNIVVTGYVDDTRQYLEKSAVFACAMTSGTGIKNKVLEAMALGVPVVANTLAMNGIAASAGRDFLKADDPVSFAAAIASLFADPARGRSLGDAGRAFVTEHHSWDRTAAVVTDVYERIIR